MDIAFLGMGIMGAPMTANCLKAGHTVTVYNRTPEKCQPLRRQGARVAGSPAEAARGRKTILICVEDTPDVEEVLFGDQGVVHGLDHTAEPPALIIDHSTISPDAAEECSRKLSRDHGALFLDAPVSGGDSGARSGRLAIMCGGPAEAFHRAKPLLQAMGETIVHVGTRNGDGQRCKIINQVLVAINCLATTEAMRLGEQVGLNMDNVLAAISQGAAASWSLSNLGPRWLRRDFEPGFRLRHLLKDIKFAAEAIEALPPEQVAGFPGIELALDLIQQSVDVSYGDCNIHAVARIFDQKAPTR